MQLLPRILMHLFLVLFVVIAVPISMVVAVASIVREFLAGGGARRMYEHGTS